MREAVLCAVDISNENRDIDVLKQAARLAEMDGRQLDVITVVPDYGMSVVGSFFEPGHHEKAVAEARTRLEQLVTDALGPEANARVRHIVATGRAYDSVF